MIGSTRMLLAALCVAALAPEAGAQERRRSPAGGQSAATTPAADVRIPDVPRDPARPFVGVRPVRGQARQQGLEDTRRALEHGNALREVEVHGSTQVEEGHR